MLARVLRRLRPDRSAAAPASPSRPDLSWVAEWIENVRDHVFVRAEDRVFVQRPNRACHLNEAGIAILGRLLDGEALERILEPHGGDPRVWCDVERFLLDVRTMLKHGLDDTYESAAVDKVPFELGFSAFPVLSEVAVTYRCNARCRFCYAGCNCTQNPIQSDREMSLDQVKTVLDKIRREALVPSVSFTGGEATLRPDLPEMVRHARSLGLRVNLITNGILSTEERVAALVDAGLNSVQVSIEGTTASLHDAITRIRGSWDKAVAAVRRYLAAGVTVNSNTTITRPNLHDVVRFPAFARRELGLDAFSMNLMIPTGTGALDRELVVRYTEVGPVLEQVQEASRAVGIRFSWYSPTPMCIFNPISKGLGNKGCAACDGLLSVGADGQLLPCASYDEPVGDLLAEPFDRVWNDERARSFRTKEHAHPLCRSCEHFAACNGACPLYWRQLGYGELFAARRPAGTEETRA